MPTPKIVHGWPDQPLEPGVRVKAVKPEKEHYVRREPGVDTPREKPKEVPDGPEA